jgi:glycosyltransferase involved in cell wall biosynthesis
MKISIITVCFNTEKTIEQTINSVLGQTYKDIEYIIVDGISKDNTLKIVGKYMKKISKVVSEKDKGLYDAMNKGVRIAKGQVIYFLNADDVLVNKNIIKEVAKEFEKEDFDLVFGDVEFYYPKENKKVKISRNASLNDLKNGNMPPHQGSFVKKEFLIKHPFNLKYKSSADFDFFCNLLKEKPRIKKINKIISRMIVGGVSSGVISYKETEEIIRKHFGNYCYYKIKTKHTVFTIIKMIFALLRINYHKG